MVWEQDYNVHQPIFIDAGITAEKLNRCILTSQGQRSGFRGEADATADHEAVRSEKPSGRELFWFLSTVQHMTRAIINQLATLKRSWDLSQDLRSTYLQTVVFLGETRIFRSV